MPYETFSVTRENHGLEVQTSGWEAAGRWNLLTKNKENPRSPPQIGRIGQMGSAPN
jgi:hypothetical protein